MARYLVLDLETAPLPNAADYLDPVSAAKNLVDPAKIKADIERRTADQINDAGLDWNVNRIVCVGLWGQDFTAPAIFTVTDEDQELAVLAEVSALIDSTATRSRATIVGFCCRRFDVPVLLQRARYLGLTVPRISLKRWDNPHILDLYDVLTFDDQPCTSVMRRTLTSFCRRFGIDVPDASTGKDMAALVAAGDWAAVEAHCRADVERTRLLAERLGVFAEVAA